MFGILFGLISALAWGGGDFCGGQAARRTSVVWVLVIGELAGILLLSALALVVREPLPTLANMGYATVAGAFGTLGLAMLYRGLAVGRAAIVAPTSAVVAATIPVLVAALSVGLPGPLRVFGFALALVSIWLVSQAGDAAAIQSGFGLALAAGIGFGGFFVLIAQAGADRTFWPLAVARAVALPFTLGILARRGQLWHGPGRNALWIALLSGALDVAGNLFFLLAKQYGRLDTAAVLSSLYPASTVILARLLLGEQMRRSQLFGLALALLAIVLIVV